MKTNKAKVADLEIATHKAKITADKQQKEKDFLNVKDMSTDKI